MSHGEQPRMGDVRQRLGASLGRVAEFRRAKLAPTFAALAAVGLLLAFAPSALAAEDGQITGKVTGASTKAALAGIQVCAQQASGGEGGSCASTNSSGEYTISTLATGSYTVYFSSPDGSGLNYIPQFYNDKASFSEAEAVAVEAGKTKSSIDAAMVEGGQITGKVTKASGGAAIEGLQVCAQEAGGHGFEFGHCASTNASGVYTISGLASGSYKVEFRAGETCGPSGCTQQNYLTQFYNDKSTLAEAEAVAVTAGATKSGIDAAMVEGGQITGSVTKASGGAAIEGLQVCALEASGGGGFSGHCAQTSSTGEYTIAGLATGSYKVEFRAGETCGPSGCTQQNYLTQFYNGKSSFSEADPVAVTAGGVKTGIDAAMVVGGQITGKVTDASSKAIAGIQVCAQPASGGGFGSCASTNGSGEYTISGLASGSYKVEFRAGVTCTPTCTQQNYLTQFYNGKASFSEADPVAVTAGSVKTGIDAKMVAPSTSKPVNTKASELTGTPVVGETLSCSEGSWTGTPAPTFTYRWLRDGVEISGQTASTYKVAEADQGHAISCEVTASNTAGSASATSAVVNVSTATANYTWTGEAELASHEWSNTSNWVGGKAPASSSSIGTLSLPTLTGPGCGMSIIDTCYQSHNNLTELTVHELQLGIGNGGHNYEVSGEGITLGSGGLVALAAGSAETAGETGAVLSLPITLGAPQTWSITGRSGGRVGEHGVALEASASVTGSADALTLDTSNGAGLDAFGSDIETGAITVDGANSSDSGAEAVLNGGVLMTEAAKLNGSDGNPVTLNHVGLETVGKVEVGPLTSVGADVVAGNSIVPVGPTAQASHLQVASASFDSSSELALAIVGVGSGASEYSQLASIGLIALGGATLSVTPPPAPEGSCSPALPAGQVYTLISTTGTLSGAFANVSEGGEITLAQAPPCAQQHLRVSYHESGATKTVTGTVVAATTPPANIGAPEVTGTPVVGETLSCSTGSWGGTPVPTLSYKWLRDGVAIAGATISTYKLQAADEGHNVSCEVTAKNTAGEKSTTSSNSVSVPSLPTNTEAPKVSGTPAVGETLSCSTGVWTGSPAPTFTYEWLRDGVAISGAMASTYKLQAADEAHNVSCEVTATNAAGEKSAPSNSVSVASLPANSVLPQISGTPKVGETLSCSNGTWSGSPAPTFTYMWLRDGTAISGATASTYKVQAADEGHTLTCEVTAKNIAGSKSAPSSSVKVTVTAVAPANTEAPSVSGAPAAGQTLICSKGSWTGTPAPTFAYRWLRDGTAIVGATESSYVVQAADEGHTLICEVTAKNSAGEKGATSAGVSVPVASPTPTNTGGGGSGNGSGGSGGAGSGAGGQSTGAGPTARGGVLGSTTHKAPSARCKVVHVKIKHSKKTKTMRVCPKPKKHSKGKKKHGH
jgi:Carboxypeptidase regulatory-like domain